MAEAKKAKEQQQEKNKLSKEVSTIIEQVEQLTVLQLAELVEALEEKFGVSATPVAAPASVAAATGGGAGAAAEEETKTEFNVVLTSFGDKKIQVIKAVRTLKPDIGLADAKKLVESVPATILENAKKEEAEEAKKKLEEAGGTVELK